jgi:hypothetical protein
MGFDLTTICIHHTHLIQEPVCPKGIDRRVISVGSPFNVPCVIPHLTCAMRELLTHEDLERERKAMMARVKHNLAIIESIRIKASNKPGNGFMACPDCKSGKLEYCIHSNRQLEATCSTPGCFRYMLEGSR